MRCALIMAGGAGTRLWPMSRARRPKQLIPFLEGKSLLELAFERFEGLLPAAARYVCAGQQDREAILAALPSLRPEHFIGVFTADHLIEPAEEFRRVIALGFELVERDPRTMVTFGIAPTGPATGYGYLELGPPLEPPLGPTARAVRQFREKPPLAVAQQYVEAGPERYLWNSGMFVWRAATLLDCIRRYEPAVWEGLRAIAQAWDAPQREQVLAQVYPTLKRISVDFAVMEPASRDPAVRVAAIPMRLRWLDVGSWPSFAETCAQDAQGNALAAPRRLLCDSARCLVASNDPEHLVAVVGCQDLVVIHTPDVTLVCRADMAEKIKDAHKLADAQFGGRYT